jgi:hypothetical protein
VRGLFVFVSGRIARLAGEAMTVDMPSATIGIRGSRLIGSVAAGGGRQQVTLLADPDGNVGEIVVTNAAGTQVLNRPQTTTWTIGDGRAPAPPATLPRRLLGRFHPGLQRLFSARRADAEAKIGGARPAVRQAAASDRSRDDDPPPFEILGEATTRIDDGGGSDEVSSGSAGHDPSADAMAAELADFTTASGAPPEVPIPMVGVPYLKPNGSLSQASIQTYVKVRDDHDARTVCQWMPRIRDIILGALQRRPLRHGAVGTRPKGRERLLAKVVNASMKWNLVVDIRLAPYAARSDDPGSERTSFSCEDVEVQAQRKKDARRRGRDVSSLSRRARSGRHRRD